MGGRDGWYMLCPMCGMGGREGELELTKERYGKESSQRRDRWKGEFAMER